MNYRIWDLIQSLDVPLESHTIFHIVFVFLRIFLFYVRLRCINMMMHFKSVPSGITCKIPVPRRTKFFARITSYYILYEKWQNNVFLAGFCVSESSKNANFLCKNADTLCLVHRLWLAWQHIGGSSSSPASKQQGRRNVWKSGGWTVIL